MKTVKQIEKHVKGIANHRRIEILFLVSDGQGLTVNDIAKSIGCNFKTISGHISKLVNAGLLDKKYSGVNVLHSLSPYGKIFIKFLKDFRKL